MEPIEAGKYHRGFQNAIGHTLRNGCLIVAFNSSRQFVTKSITGERKIYQPFDVLRLLNLKGKYTVNESQIISQTFCDRGIPYCIVKTPNGEIPVDLARLMPNLKSGLEVLASVIPD